eukprot:5781391-Pyramimonas_sp.AAC.1
MRRDFELVDGAALAMIKVQDLLHDYKEELFLPVEVSKRIMNHVDDFLLRYQKLASGADSNGEALWNNPAKFHWLWHWSRRSMFLNPSRANTFVDEDFVGKMKTVVHSCSAGSSLPRMQDASAEKYRWGLDFAMRW